MEHYKLNDMKNTTTNNKTKKIMNTNKQIKNLKTEIKLIDINQRIKEIEAQATPDDYFTLATGKQELKADSKPAKEILKLELEQTKEKNIKLVELANRVIAGEEYLTPHDFYKIHHPDIYHEQTDYYDHTELKGRAGKNWIDLYLNYWNIILERDEYFLTHNHPETTFKHIDTSNPLNKLTHQMKRNRQRAFKEQTY